MTAEMPELYWSPKVGAFAKKGNTGYFLDAVMTAADDYFPDDAVKLGDVEDLRTENSWLTQKDKESTQAQIERRRELNTLRSNIREVLDNIGLYPSDHRAFEAIRAIVGGAQ